MSRNEQTHGNVEGNGAALRALELRLEQERPTPAPAFRGQLGRSVEARSRGMLSRTAMRRLALLCLLAGLLLLALATLGLAGAGPLG